MRDYSIERELEHIDNPKTRAYMAEIYSSYVNGNYRATLVGLWTVVVCDLLFKLQELRSLRGDQAATRILEKIEDQQSKNPTSPDWEKALLDAVVKETELLDSAEGKSLEHLQTQRHLAAHPVLRGPSLDLHAPSIDQVRALLRTALEGLLTKPAFMTRRLFDHFMEDIEARKDQLPTESDLEKYLQGAYLSRLRVPVKGQIFESLWRLVFKLENERCEKNRTINFRVLRLVYEDCRQEALRLLGQKPSHFGELSSQTTLQQYLVTFCAHNPEVWERLPQHAQTPIRGAAKGNNWLNVAGWFLEEPMSLEAHISRIDASLGKGDVTDELPRSAFSLLVSIAKTSGLGTEALRLGITAYGNSANFDAADKIFRESVGPFLGQWGEELFAEFTKAASHSQAYGRWRAHQDHMRVVGAFEARFPDSDFPMPDDESVATTFGAKPVDASATAEVGEAGVEGVEIDD